MAKFIMESAIIQEAEIIKDTSTKAIFRAVVQTCDEINSNKRKYPKELMEQGMRDNYERMKRRAFFCELDHPFPQGNDTFDNVRQTTVALKETCHIITDYEFRGNLLVAEMETLTNRWGKDLHSMLRDKTGIGFSMRGMAELQMMREDYNLVKSPILIISYDAVSNPSHKSAVVDFNEMRFESSMLVESSSGIICSGDQCFLPNYFDKLVESKIITFFDKWI